jgi:2-oxoacid:acceptor oxidoreductase delta subunit (pyruvate/2-ketoisovalerate family)
MRLKSSFAGPWASPDRLHIIQTGEWRYQRPVTKVQKCCQCGTCYLFCPTGSIRNRGTHFASDLDYCKGCGLCARVCPVNAIMMVREERG